MKYVSSFAPVFNPAAGTLDFSAYAGTFVVNQLMGVVDITADQTLYLPGLPGLGVSALSGNGLVLTLQASVSALAATDVLQIFYDDGQGLGTSAANIVPDTGAAGVVGYLSSLYGLAAGKRVITSPGALMRAPQLEDLLRDLIVEVSMTNLILQTALQVDLDTDIDGLTRSELYETTAN